jgi:hypothetical protein
VVALDEGRQETGGDLPVRRSRARKEESEMDVVHSLER